MNIKEGRRQNHLLLYTALPLDLGVATASFALLGSSLPNHTPPHLNLTRPGSGCFPLEISPSEADIGVLPPGRSARAFVTVRNAECGTAISLRFESSCPCVSPAPCASREAVDRSSALTSDLVRASTLHLMAPEVGGPIVG